MKILDLFNEYNLSPEMTGGEVEQPRTEKDRNTMSRMDKAYIVSKDFGFIKRLVDNDKVDLKKADNIDNGPLFDFYYDRDGLIMALSINDEPLKFLISILK